MIEQKSAPKKKQQVGSLFFHLFHRISLWIYTILCNSLPARLLTSYETQELRWSRLCTFIFGTPDTKFRKKLHLFRLFLARLLENSKLLRAADSLIRFLIHCPLNVYGTFFLIYGAVGAAVYFIADRLSVNYAGNIGWGIAGIVIAVCALPLLCSGKSLYRAAFGSRIIGKILRSYLGLEQIGQGQDKKERGGTGMMYLALLLGVALGLLTFFYHPATIPLLFVLSALVVLVLYIPEAGVLLAASTIWLWWGTGHPALCAVSISFVTLLSFISKLIRGKRVIHVRLVDATVLLLGGIFATHGVISQGGVTSLFYGVGYTLLIAMYFPIVNLMRSREWLDRSYKLLALSGAVLSLLSVLPMTRILNFLDMMFVRVDLTMFADMFVRYDAYFGQGTLIGGILILLLPIMLSGLVGKRSVTGFFWKMLWIVVGCISVVACMHFGVWVGLGVALVLFFLMYSYRSLSAAMFLAFPGACAVVWYAEIDSFLNLRSMETVQALIDVGITYINGEAQRLDIWSSALSMIKDHILGVGLGEHAVHAVFPQYAVSGMESLTDFQNAYIQLAAECGLLAVVVLAAVLLLFTMSVLTYLKWGSNEVTKARVAAGFAGVAAVLVLGLFCNFWNDASLFILLWLVISLSLASMRTQYETLARAVQTHGATGERTDIAFRSK